MLFNAIAANPLIAIKIATWLCFFTMYRDLLLFDILSPCIVVAAVIVIIITFIIDVRTVFLDFQFKLLIKPHRNFFSIYPFTHHQCIVLYPFALCGKG
jgi:hypothetical protein